MGASMTGTEEVTLAGREVGGNLNNQARGEEAWLFLRTQFDRRLRLLICRLPRLKK